MPASKAENATAKAAAKSKVNAQRERDGSGSEGSAAPPAAKIHKGGEAGPALLSEDEMADDTVAPATLEAMMAMMITDREAAAQREHRQTRRDEGFTSTMSSLSNQFALLINRQAEVDDTLKRIQAQIDSQSADLVTLKKERATSPTVPASGAASSGGVGRPPPAARVGGSVPPRRVATDRRDQPDTSRAKVFFKGFPGEIPRRLLTAWFDRLYDLTAKEPGVERHIGSNSSFAVSFPSADGAKKFMDQVRDSDLSLDYTHRGTVATIKMEPQYRASAYGKALSSVWQLFTNHFKDQSTAEDPLLLLVDTDRGRFRAEIKDEIVLLAHVDKGVLILDRVGMEAVGFSAEAGAAIRQAFVA
jgi:hypothetical protein